MAPAIPPVWQERIECSIQAARSYGLPPAVMLAIAEREGGKPGQRIRNRNGTWDLGAMQINTTWLAELSRFGVSAAAVLSPGCYSYRLAAWRVRNHLLNDRGDYWTRVANYHSANPAHNAPYRTYIVSAASRWNNWLARLPSSTQGASQASALPKTSTAQLRVSSTFGMRRHPIRGGWRQHMGVDLPARAGTPVSASANGRIIYAGNATGYGQLVVIEHSGGLQTRYAHLSRIVVGIGQQVGRGNTIGLVGSTGDATGPHLHYEVRVGGVAVDPMRYFTKG